jgi:hypothetical protein
MDSKREIPNIATGVDVRSSGSSLNVPSTPTPPSASVSNVSKLESFSSKSDSNVSQDLLSKIKQNLKDERYLISLQEQISVSAELKDISPEELLNFGTFSKAYGKFITASVKKAQKSLNVPNKMLLYQRFIAYITLLNNITLKVTHDVTSSATDISSSHNNSQSVPSVLPDTVSSATVSSTAVSSNATRASTGSLM